jgi:RNA polymerase sigma-70 factor (ECF subfamily)
MSSTFPAARFPALPLSRGKDADPDYIKDTATPSDEPSDEALIDRIRRDDGEALTLLFRRYSHLVWSIAERIVRDRGEAEDLLQEVFLMVYRKASLFEPTKGPARRLIVHMTYLLACKRRRYLKGRHSHYSRPLDEDVTDTLAETPLFYDESLEAHFGKDGLQKALADLSVLQRETLRLYFFEGYELDEIAPKLGQSLGNVRHHYFRGLERLRRQLPGQGKGRRE